MLVWFIAIPLLWITPQWRLLAFLCAVQITLLVALVWSSSGFYREAIQRYPEVMSEHWASLLAGVQLNVGLFAVVGSADLRTSVYGPRRPQVERVFQLPSDLLLLPPIGLLSDKPNTFGHDVSALRTPAIPVISL